MKKILVAVAIAATAINVQAESVSDVWVYTPGVNLEESLPWGDEGIMYAKTLLDHCAYGGRIAFPMTMGGKKAFDVVLGLHKDDTPIGKLNYEVIGVVQTSKGPKDICVAVNVRKP